MSIRCFPFWLLVFLFFFLSRKLKLIERVRSLVLTGCQLHLRGGLCVSCKFDFVPSELFFSVLVRSFVLSCSCSLVSSFPRPFLSFCLLLGFSFVRLFFLWLAGFFLSFLRSFFLRLFFRAVVLLLVLSLVLSFVRRPCFHSFVLSLVRVNTGVIPCFVFVRMRPDPGGLRWGAFSDERSISWSLSLAQECPPPPLVAFSPIVGLRTCGRDIPRACFYNFLVH